MSVLTLSDIQSYVEENIGTFHQRKIDSLSALSLKKVLKRKNPYLFKAKYILTAEEIVRGLVDAHISSNEETIFGHWLEGLAIFVNQRAFGGWKSAAGGIDLEFDLRKIRYLVSIKSGPNWGNSSQIKKMQQDFNAARRILRTSNFHLNVCCVNGCCYGTDDRPDKGDYYKYCGQRFWHLISGMKNLYKELIDPLSCRAKECNDHFQEIYCSRINLFTMEFGKLFCNSQGSIMWQKLLEFNSAASD